MKKHLAISFSTCFIVIVSFYIVGSIMQNILAVKTFGTDTISITTAGTLISWMVFLCLDLITEIWGRKKAIIVFWSSAILNLIFTGIAWICIVIPGNNAFIGEAYKVVLGSGWRIVTASILAFILGNYANTLVMYLMRIKSKDSSNSFSFICRAILSTILGQAIDNGLFMVLAFAPIGIQGTIEQSWTTIGQIIGFTTAIEVVAELFVSPLTAFLVKKLKAMKEKENIQTDIELGKE